MSRYLSIATAAVCLSAIAASAYAGVTNDIPSCYAANHIEPMAGGAAHELFIAIDQTTVFDEKLRAQIMEMAGKAIRPAGAYTLFDFSAFSQGHYTEVVTRGVIESQMPEKVRNDISERALRSFDACMTGQAAFARKVLLSDVTHVESMATNDLAKSDILAALKDISDKVRASPASDKVVLLASDMLENSSVSSFYAHDAVRRIDPRVEIKKASAAGMIGDFGGARVYVIGAGLLAGDAKVRNVYRDPQTINALKQFWTLYFERSNASIGEFGTPALLGTVGY
ncbi:hypothetical protein OVY01_04690 [Robbsia sp. Bb-Pol-6]|uniref:Uncharacterized protein n=1 Tax=Robbsia betulipollinis TaxID=2981849 RepID=A0ABT3ZJ62_9BURK|nr:hypothetical protein [Robbsia betulipollinis]MCY0386545.1 hypothetical protein [Robbsia betulipollinis]